MKALLAAILILPKLAHSEVRSVGEFHGIAVETGANIELTVGPATQVDVDAPKDWLPKIETRVVDGTLHIATPAAHGHLPQIKVTITTPLLDAIAISGASHVHAAKLADKSLAVDVSGAAELDLAGTAEQLAVAISGQAKMKLKDLVVGTAALQVSGACDGELHATRSLAAAISGAASLVVYGKPAITRSITGVGTIESR
jgi:hypothetical protein